LSGTPFSLWLPELISSKLRIRSSGLGSITFRLLKTDCLSPPVTNNLSLPRLLQLRILRSLKISQDHLTMDRAHHYH
jgi:hypothetical protein